MISYLSIGDFSRATHMTVKSLRHYHRIGLLEPADVDPHTGYRRYTTEQIPSAQVIRRFRELDMPLEDIQAVLAAPDLKTRNDRITAHLARLEDALDRTRCAVASLRDLLAPPSPQAPLGIEVRSVAATPAAAITGVVDAEDSASWLQGALGEIYATLTAQHVAADGPAGGIFADDVFTHHRGQVTVFVSGSGPVRPTGRVTSLVVPACELAVITYSGPPARADRAYGALATYVARHALAVDGAIREHYLVGQRDTADPSQWRTEIGWPVFQTATGLT
ncbi:MULTISPECIES: MerR family transcriptional regulator [Actinomadura]|uniref:MerR family transcriptional regulator n=1 Tax=Actinomadura yumaensis TaxID=111807 RepID=A0ABW2CDK5_9ACTN|nr:MerR family transcriptional regulator [Actinomadura sp. J1-007]MWK35617.1 MerR family transcriptional regulator [Actinomadura sp. J1-007]